MKPLLLLLFSFTLFCAKSQQTKSTAISSIRSALQRLAQNKKLLYIGLFPGDENARLLTAMREKYHFQTAFLMLTRGEGMHNYSGTDQGIDLGIIHTAEMDAAAQAGGVDLFATACLDIGARDTATLSQVWNRQRLLADMATVIRKYRPDIIVAGDVRSVAGDAVNSWLSQLCTQANQVAGTSETKLLAGAPVTLQGEIYHAPWLLMQTAAKDTIQHDSLLEISMTGFDTVSGMDYRALALKAKREERSLFADLDTIDLGPDTQYYKLLEGKQLPDLQNDTAYGGWTRLPNGRQLRDHISGLLPILQNNAPVTLLPALEKLYLSLQANKKLDTDQKSLSFRLKSLLMDCAGLSVDASTDKDLGVLGQDFKLRIHLDNPLLPVQISRIQVSGLLDTLLTDQGAIALRQGQGLLFEQKLHLKLFQAAYQPFWLDKPFNDDGSYQIDQLMQGRLLDSACFQATLSVLLDTTPLEISVPLKFSRFDRSEGIVSRPFYTVEPVLLTLSPDVLLTRIEGDTKPFKNAKLTLKLKTLFQDSAILAKFKIRQVGLEAAIGGQSFKTGEAEDLYQETTYLSPSPGQQMHVDLFFDSGYAKKWHPGTPMLKPQVILQLQEGTQAFSSNIKSVGYSYQPNSLYNYHSQTIVVADTVKTKGSRIAYIGGRSNDAIENALHQLGYRLSETTLVDLLKISLPENANDSTPPSYVIDSLAHFDAIVLNGLSTDNPMEEDALKKLQVLFKAYVAQGAVLLNLNTQASAQAVMPVPDTIHEKILSADHHYADITANQNDSLFQYPNEIKVAHFIGWSGLMAKGGVGLKTQGVYPIKLHVLADNTDIYPVSQQKAGAGAFINCFLDLPSQLSNGRPFAFKFLANLIAVAHRGVSEKNEKNNPSSTKTVKENMD